MVETQEVLRKMKQDCILQLVPVEAVKMNDLAIMKKAIYVAEKSQLHIMSTKNPDPRRPAYVFSKNKKTYDFVNASYYMDASDKEPLVNLMTVLGMHLLFAGKFWQSEPAIGDTVGKHEFRVDIFVMTGILLYLFFGKEPYGWIYTSVYTEETMMEVYNLMMGEPSKYTPFLEYAETVCEGMPNDEVDVLFYKNLIIDELKNDVK